MRITGYVVPVLKGSIPTTDLLFFAKSFFAGFSAKTHGVHQPPGARRHFYLAYWRFSDSICSIIYSYDCCERDHFASAISFQASIGFGELKMRRHLLQIRSQVQKSFRL